MSISGIGNLLWPLLEQLPPQHGQQVINRIWKKIGAHGPAPKLPNTKSADTGAGDA